MHTSSPTYPRTIQIFSPEKQGVCVCLLACWHILVLTYENTGNFFFWELVPIAMLAGVVGLLGTQFIRATVAVNRFRAKYYT